MVEYKCEKCNKVFTHKNTYKRHSNRKVPCDKQIGEPSADKHVCKRCGKKYSSYKSLYKHSKICERMLIQNIQNNTQNIEQLNNLNVDGDVKVVKFGDENLSYISDDLFKHILGRGFKAVSEFIEHSHFNAEHPENHNIYIANIKENYIIMYDGDKWTIHKKDDVMEDIIYAKSDFLNLKFKELMDQMKDHDVQKFKNFINQRDDDQTMNRLKEELKLQLYNNRYLPQKLRKHLEKKNRIADKKQDTNISELMSMINGAGRLDRSKIAEIKRILND